MCTGFRKQIYLAALLVLASCSRQHKDRAIKADITTKAKSEIALAGVQFTVSDGAVTLSGICPSAKEKDKAERTVKKIAGVTKVVSSITLGPVVLDEDFSLRQSVDSVLMRYNLAQAQVENSTVTLTGQVQKAEQQKLLNALQKLPVAAVVNQLSVQ